jgi:hypothetical protein
LTACSTLAASFEIVLVDVSTSTVDESGGSCSSFSAADELPVLCENALQTSTERLVTWARLGLRGWLGQRLRRGFDWLCIDILCCSRWRLNNVGRGVFIHCACLASLSQHMR